MITVLFSEDSISENSFVPSIDALIFPKSPEVNGGTSNSSLSPKPSMGLEVESFATYPIGVLVKSESRFDLRSFI